MTLERFLGTARRCLLPTKTQRTNGASQLVRYCALVLGLSLSLAAHAQAPIVTPSDTVRLTLPEAEHRFVLNNLQLLAQRYNITAQQALAVQARLIDNPTITLDQNA